MPDDLRRRGVLMVHARYRAPGGEDVSVAAERAVLEAAGVPVRLLEVPATDGAGPGAALGAVWNRAVAARLRSLLAEASPAVVHIQNLWPAASPAVIAVARAAGVPVVATLRNARLLCPAATLWRDGAPCMACAASPWPGIWRGCWRASRLGTVVSAAAHRGHPAWRGVDRFIVPSAFLRDVLAPVVPPGRVTVVPNRLPPLPPPRPGVRRGLLYAGRLVPEKGVSVLLEAARRIGASMTVLGQGPVSVPGARAETPAGVWEAMERAAVVAVPSLWPEPFGRAALEGMDRGAAVVASSVGGLPEVVGDAGLLVSPGDVDAWAAALLRALADTEVLGARGRARALRLAGDGAAPLMAVYRSLLTAPVAHHQSARAAKAGTVRR